MRFKIHIFKQKLRYLLFDNTVQATQIEGLMFKIGLLLYALKIVYTIACTASMKPCKEI